MATCLQSESLISWPPLATEYASTPPESIIHFFHVQYLSPKLELGRMGMLISGPEALEWFRKTPMTQEYLYAHTAYVDGLCWRYKTTPDPEQKGVAINDLFHQCRRQYVADDKRPCPRGWSREPVSEEHEVFKSVRGREFDHMETNPPFCYKHVSSRKIEYRYPIPFEEFREESEPFPGMIFAPFIACRAHKSLLFASEPRFNPGSGEPLHKSDYLTLTAEDGSWAGTLVPNEGPDWATSADSLSEDESDGSTLSSEGGKAIADSTDSGSETTCAEERIALDVVAISLGRYLHECRPSYDPFFDELISSPSRLPLRHVEFYNVLWVEWVDGRAYRKGLGKVWKDAWHALEMENIDLVLG